MNFDGPRIREDDQRLEQQAVQREGAAEGLGVSDKGLAQLVLMLVGLVGATLFVVFGVLPSIVTRDELAWLGGLALAAGGLVAAARRYQAWSTGRVLGRRLPWAVLDVAFAALAVAGALTLLGTRLGR